MGAALGKSEQRSFAACQDDESEYTRRRKPKQVKGAQLKLAAKTSKATAKSQRHAGATRDDARMLFGFLHGFEVGFQRGAILFLRF